MGRSLLALAFLCAPLGSLAVTFSGNYTPTYIPVSSMTSSFVSILFDVDLQLQCPSGETYLRSASAGLSPDESAWLKKRKEYVVEGLASYLITVGIQGFDVNGYISALNSTKDAIPSIGFTLSGGGMLVHSLLFL